MLYILIDLENVDLILKYIFIEYWAIINYVYRKGLRAKKIYKDLMLFIWHYQNLVCFLQMRNILIIKKKRSVVVSKHGSRRRTKRT